MTTQQMREWHQARPFQPFIIRMADGRSVAVNHPETMAIAPVGRTVTVYNRSGAAQVIDLLLVTALKARRIGRTETRRRG